METERLQHLFAFLAEAPQDSFTLYSIGLEYLHMNQPEEANSYFNKVVEFDKGYVGVYYHLGKCYEQLGNSQNAIGAYEAGIVQASAKRERNAIRELQAALNQVMGIDDDE